jgi:hypothetical protein
MGSIRVSDPEVDGDYKVSLNLTDAPSVTDTYSSVKFLPTKISLRYVIDQDEREWLCTDIRITGPNIRRDGSLGKRTLDRYIMTFSNPKLPPWLTEMIEKHRPENHGNCNVDSSLSRKSN